MTSTASSDDLEREPWRAAVLHQPGHLMPVDVVCDRMSQRPRDPEPGESRHPPFVHEIIVIDGLVAWSYQLWFHLSVPEICCRLSSDGSV